MSSSSSTPTEICCSDGWVVEDNNPDTDEVEDPPNPRGILSPDEHIITPLLIHTYIHIFYRHLYLVEYLLLLKSVHYYNYKLGTLLYGL